MTPRDEIDQLNAEAAVLIGERDQARRELRTARQELEIALGRIRELEAANRQWAGNDRPKGVYQCRLCGSYWTGPQLQPNPMKMDWPWSCGTPMCGGTVDYKTPEQIQRDTAAAS